jgi:hypothetical protein
VNPVHQEFDFDYGHRRQFDSLYDIAEGIEWEMRNTESEYDGRVII